MVTPEDPIETLERVALHLLKVTNESRTNNVDNSDLILSLSYALEEEIQTIDFGKIVDDPEELEKVAKIKKILSPLDPSYLDLFNGWYAKALGVLEEDDNLVLLPPPPMRKAIDIIKEDVEAIKAGKSPKEEGISEFWHEYDFDWIAKWRDNSRIPSFKWVYDTLAIHLKGYEAWGLLNPLQASIDLQEHCFKIRKFSHGGKGIAGQLDDFLHQIADPSKSERYIRNTEVPCFGGDFEELMDDYSLTSLCESPNSQKEIDYIENLLSEVNGFSRKVDLVEAFNALLKPIMEKHKANQKKRTAEKIKAIKASASINIRYR